MGSTLCGSGSSGGTSEKPRSKKGLHHCRNLGKLLSLTVPSSLKAAAEISGAAVLVREARAPQCGFAAFFKSHGGGSQTVVLCRTRPV